MPLTLENPYLRLTLEPATGGEITGLQNIPRGRQWLWANPHPEPEPQPYGVCHLAI